MVASGGAAIDLAIIGGTGVYALAELQDVETHQPVTKYGPASGPVRIGTMAGKRVAFLARHGEGHSVPPHKVNYRANLSALQALGYSTAEALGAISKLQESDRGATEDQVVAALRLLGNPS